MKNLAIILLAVAAIGLGAWGVSQQNKINTQSAQLTHNEEQLAHTRKQLAALKTELQKQREAVEHAKFTAANERILQQVLAETEAGAAAQSKKAEHLQQSLAAARTNNPMQGFAAMFKDPKMREMMKAQQKAALGPMLERQYKALFQQLNLTPEQAATLKGLLEKKMFAGMDVGFSMLDNTLDASQRADLEKQVKSQTDEIDRQIKQFLGDENYQVFQDYEKTIPGRTVVNQFNDQLAGSGNGLSAQQQDQLIQAMSEARSNFKWTTDLNHKAKMANGDYTAMFTEDNINKFTRDQKRFDQQFLAQAQQILTPQQLMAFQEFQKNQLQLQVVSMKMAAQMFAPKSQ